MAVPKRDIEILLEKVEVTGVPRLPAAARHLGACQLIWPRPTIARKAASLPLALSKGRWDGDGRPWGDRILFKEPVQGTFAIDFQVTEPVTEAAFKKWIRAGASSFLKLAGSAAEDAAALPGLGALSEIPFVLLSKAILGDDAPDVLYGGLIDISPSDLPSAGHAKTLEIPLVSRKTIRRAQPPVGKNSAPRHPRVVLREGDPVGRCMILLKTL